MLPETIEKRIPIGTYIHSDMVSSCSSPFLVKAKPKSSAALAAAAPKSSARRNAAGAVDGASRGAVPKRRAQNERCLWLKQVMESSRD